MVRAKVASHLRRNSVLTQTRVFLQFKLFGCFEALSGLPEPDFHSANVVGATFEGSLKTFLRDLDGVGE